tara:strand:- start:286 stop:522 length:237 start_codon:yes stop_codon:yes gene_type:complete
MFERITLKFMIIIILLFAFINIYPLEADNIDINTIDMIETLDISNVETKEILFLPYAKSLDTPRVSYPIFKTNLDLGS